jgi:hypothetical protein
MVETTSFVFKPIKDTLLLKELTTLSIEYSDIGLKDDYDIYFMHENLNDLSFISRIVRLELVKSECDTVLLTLSMVHEESFVAFIQD